ncbi:uncharacterized protein LOC132187642 isoform X1 [Corylus avellana]|uniref:uncharacterized protein LOC132187642 isoform X1 n=1 Tax=Corylus avellana TaxID=13451 RepID=UPI001E1F53F4|nr:uncharacterized protein LOC132187642 isoform X1 [Corylus avellana]
MANKNPIPLNSSSAFVVFIICSLFLSSTVLAKSRRPISDTEVRQKKNECYADVESGLWGWQCKSSMIAKENCALRCLSTPCYELIYASDPLEEGEKDLFRSQEFKFCMHKLSMGESLEGIKGSFDY